MKDKMAKEWQAVEDMAKHAPSDWKEAVVERCVVDCIGWQEDNPKKSLDHLIWTEIMMYLDPVIGEPVRLEPAQVVMCILDIQRSIERARKDEMPVSYMEYDQFVHKAINFALENMVKKIQQQLNKNI